MASEPGAGLLVPERSSRPSDMGEWTLQVTPPPGSRAAGVSVLLRSGRQWAQPGSFKSGTSRVGGDTLEQKHPGGGVRQWGRLQDQAGSCNWEHRRGSHPSVPCRPLSPALSDHLALNFQGPDPVLSPSGRSQITRYRCCPVLRGAGPLRVGWGLRCPASHPQGPQAVGT